MGTYVEQIPNDEAFWIGLVKTNMRLGWEKCLVPLGNINPNVAKTLADSLDVRLEVTEEGYVFIKDELRIWPRKEVAQDLAIR